MIDRVHFENFKSLQNVTLELGRLTALVGPNGCGKSSVLQGLQMLSRQARQAKTTRNLTATRRLMYRGAPGKLALSMRRGDGDEVRINAQIEADGSGEENIFRPPDRLGEFTSAYLHLEASKMARTSVAKNERPRMAVDGSGLASTLAWLKGAAEDELALITADLGHVVPGVKRIRTLRERIARRRVAKMVIDGQPIWREVAENPIGDRFAIEFDDGSEVPADLLSEGTVLALGLLTKLREPERPRLFLIDDIDRGLHLGAQVKLVQLLRELMKLDPDLQILCTTHSPYLLDLFEPAEVRVLVLDSERRTHARPLTDHPDFGKWKFGTQTGELWAALGETWVVSGAPG